MSETKLQSAIQSNSTFNLALWPNYLNFALQLMNLSNINTSSCLLCASLVQPLLTAVPVNNPFALSTDTAGTAPSPPMSSIPLLRNPAQNISLCYITTTYISPSFVCHSNRFVSSPLYAPPLVSFWCNGSLYQQITTSSPGPCVLITIVPQLNMYSPEEFAWLLRPHIKRGVFIPFAIGIGFTISASLSAGALGHTLYTAKEFNSQLQQVIESTASSLASLQRQLTSLAQVALQNRRALDLITPEKGGTCLFLQEECCFYVNESGLVEQNIQTLQTISYKLHNFYQSPSRWLDSPFLSWIPSMIPSLIILLLLLTLGPLLVKQLLVFIKQQIEVLHVAKPIQVHYHRLDHMDHELIGTCC
ncbi:endogenous retrovirus group FC1 Env polyprotein-like isoform X1 [Nannospalax galili]|uniref:endogenous retrovirus group FC1 Env polyprotein-like isoform X1 n=1 Tax=Nannospalax galili TaxID=1026970 RepID=UPI00111C7811|nr:endogenous retrovirus group FC1 Env polyprotein-like isoform X1 [Nannospalax galili]